MSVDWEWRDHLHFIVAHVIILTFGNYVSDSGGVIYTITVPRGLLVSWKLHIFIITTCHYGDLRGHSGYENRHFFSVHFLLSEYI